MQSNLEELERLRTIINEMLFLSRADHGEIATNLKPASLAQIVRETAEFLEVVFEEGSRKLNISGDAPVLAEAALLKRAVTNLLTNAVQHGTPQTDINVEIILRCSGAVESVRTSRPDNPANEKTCLKNRLYRISKERKNSVNNHGLGLAIVRAVANMHGGEVFAQSRNGIITIGFSLPCTYAENWPQPSRQ